MPPGSEPAALPGGYKVGEKVFYTAASQFFPSGNKLVHGQHGEVTGPGTAETHKGKGVSVLFPGNKGTIGCYLGLDSPLRKTCSDFGDLEISKNGERVGTTIARLAVRLETCGLHW